jgi:hypothetical protein
MLGQVAERLQSFGVTLKWDDLAVSLLCASGF